MHILYRSCGTDNISYSLVVSDIASILIALIALESGVPCCDSGNGLVFGIKGNYPFEGVYGLKFIYPDWNPGVLQH